MAIVIARIILGATQNFDKDEGGTNYVYLIALYDEFPALMRRNISATLKINMTI